MGITYTEIEIENLFTKRRMVPEQLEQIFRNYSVYHRLPKQ